MTQLPGTKTALDELKALRRRIQRLEQIQLPAFQPMLDSLDALESYVVSNNASIAALQASIVALNAAITAANNALTTHANNSLVLLHEQVTAVAFNNTAAESTLYSFTIPGNTLGTKNKLRLVLNGVFQNNTGTSYSPTIKVKYGATTVYTDVPAVQATAASFRPWRVECEIVAMNTTSSQDAYGITYTGPTSQLAGLSNGLASVRMGEHTTVAEDSTQPKSLVVTVTLAVADPNLIFTARNVYLELLRR